MATYRDIKGPKGNMIYRLESRFFYVKLAAVMVLLLFSSAWCTASEPSLQSEPSGKTPPSSAGVLAGNTLYVSGQGSRDSHGSRPAEFTAQVAQALRNVQAVLRLSGMDLGNIVSMNIYLVHAEDASGMNEVYWKTIGKNPPARTVLTVAALPDGERIEINCIAVVGTVRRQSVWPAHWSQGAHVDPPAIQVDDVLYLSAQSGQDPLTGKLPATFTDEVKQALDNVSAILGRAHMSTKNVVWVNPYLAAGGHYDEMGKVYATYFEFGNTPGRGTIQVADLPGGNHIVFSCIAGADLAKRKAIRPRNMPPSATASPGVLYGDTLYLSAKDGFIPGQGLVTPDLNLQLRQSMRNLLDGLEQADMDFSDVVSSTLYLRNVDDTMDATILYDNFFKGRLPAQSILQQVHAPNEEAAAQISFIAVRRPANSATTK